MGNFWRIAFVCKAATIYIVRHLNVLNEWIGQNLTNSRSLEMDREKERYDYN